MLFVSVQVIYLSLGSLENSWMFSNYEDEYALQGKDPSSSRLNRDPKLAGKQNMQAGNFTGTGGIPVAFGENAPDVLPARAGAPRNLHEGEADKSSSAPKLLAAQLGDVGPLPGSEGGGGVPGAEGAGGVPGPEGRGGIPGLDGGGGKPGRDGKGGRPVANQGQPQGSGGAPAANQGQPQGSGGAPAANQSGMSAFGASGVRGAGQDNSSVRANEAKGEPAKAMDPKATRVMGKPQKQMNTVDSGTSYERGLRMIYYLEARGGKYSLSRAQADYLLRLINEVEDASLHGDTTPSVEPVLVAAQPQNVGELQIRHEKKVVDKNYDEGADSYRKAFLIMYALEAKGGNYALTPKQAQILLNMIDEAESLKSVVPDAQNSLPRILTAEQLNYIRSSLSAAAAEGKRTDPSLLNSYATEVLELTK